MKLLVKFKKIRFTSLHNKYIILSLVYLCAITIASFQFTHSLFAGSAQTVQNIFASAQVFPTTGSEEQNLPTGSEATPTPTATLTPSPTDTPPPTLTITPTETESASPSAGAVVINEINWTGSVAFGTSDEWIELRNTTSGSIDLTGWTITGAATGNGIFHLSGSIPANGLFLIANFTAANSALAVTPDQVNTSLSLANSAAQYVLKDNFNGPIDAADDGVGAPPAGSNLTIKASMERNSTPGDGKQAASWHTATTTVNFDGGVTDLGTPKAAND